MTEQLDALSLSSLLASRLCHDLVNPVGAFSAGLEVMQGETDPEMLKAANELIEDSAKKSLAMLTFARIAFGAGGAYGSEIDILEGKNVLEEIYQFFKADLDWQLPAGTVPKDYCKAVLNIGLVVADCVPRKDSKVTVNGDLTKVVFTAEGPRAKLKDELQAALSANPDGLEPKMTPAYLAALLVKSEGGEIKAQLVNDTTVEIVAIFS